MISCTPLGDDGVYDTGDTCTVRCNTGYRLTGIDTRTCQSNGSWSGNDDLCSRGEYVLIFKNHAFSKGVAEVMNY